MRLPRLLSLGFFGATLQLVLEFGLLSLDYHLRTSLIVEFQCVLNSHDNLHSTSHFVDMICLLVSSQFFFVPLLV